MLPIPALSQLMSFSLVYLHQTVPYDIASILHYKWAIFHLLKHRQSQTQLGCTTFVTKPFIFHWFASFSGHINQHLILFLKQTSHSFVVHRALASVWSRGRGCMSDGKNIKAQLNAQPNTHDKIWKSWLFTCPLIVSHTQRHTRQPGRRSQRYCSSSDSRWSDPTPSCLDLIIGCRFLWQQ